jgi:hypothetical protein
LVFGVFFKKIIYIEKRIASKIMKISPEKSTGLKIFGTFSSYHLHPIGEV